MSEITVQITAWLLAAAGWSRVCAQTMQTGWRGYVEAHTVTAYTSVENLATQAAALARWE